MEGSGELVTLVHGVAIQQLLTFMEGYEFSISHVPLLNPGTGRVMLTSCNGNMANQEILA